MKTLGTADYGFYATTRVLPSNDTFLHVGLGELIAQMSDRTTSYLGTRGSFTDNPFSWTFPTGFILTHRPLVKLYRYEGATKEFTDYYHVQVGFLPLGLVDQEAGQTDFIKTEIGTLGVKVSWAGAATQVLEIIAWGI